MTAANPVVAAFGEDVRGTELAGDLLADRVAAQSDDPLGAQSHRCEHGGESDRTVADYGDGVALVDAAAHRGVMPGAHHVGQREQGPQRLVRVTRRQPGDLDEAASRQRDANRFALAAVDLAIAERPAVETGEGGARLTVKRIRYKPSRPIRDETPAG
jgi:hypothetical protein